MVTIGERAPNFTAPLAGGNAYNDVEQFTLSEAIGDGPIILAFYPAAFTSGCTKEMCAFRDSIGEFNALDAQVYGVSVDLPFAQNIWIQEHTLTFPMISDWNHEIIRKYNVILNDMYGMIESAERSVFIIDTDGVVTYRWIREDGNPDFEELITELQTVISKMS